jgi:diaminopimelate epimerase
MKEISFTKMQACGNDFIIINQDKLITKGLKNLVRKICDRKYGAGADGLLLLEKSKIADIKMRIFNPDGTEVEMCGNGASCVALFLKPKIKNSCTKISSLPDRQKSKIFKIETKAGIVESEVKRDSVKIKLIDPKDLELDIPIKIDDRILRVNFVNTGVPHTVIFVEGLDKIDMVNLARLIRYHRRFQPEGTNVDFVEILNKDSIRIRTYERGVENETLSCGTGAVASAVISNIKYQMSEAKGVCKINVHTKSGEILKVYFKYRNAKFSDIYLEGKPRIVYKGVYYV